VNVDFISEDTGDTVEGWRSRLRRKLGYLSSGNASNPFAWWCIPYSLPVEIPRRIATLAPGCVIVRSLFVDLLPSLRQAFHGKVIVDCHDADVHLAREMVRSVPWWSVAGPWANYLGVRTACRRFLPLADEIWTVSAEDAQRIRPFAGSRPVLVVPSAVDEQEIVPAASAGGDDVCAMVANFGYGPNLNATRWLVERVWPRVGRGRPAARLLLVGGRGEETIRRLAATHAGIAALGLLDDLSAIYDGTGVMLAPLQEGGGSRLKIVEAWKHGKAVLTTSKGIEGIPAPPSAALVRDDPAEFADALIALMADPSARRALGESGRRFVAEQLCVSQIERQLVARSILCNVGLEARQTHH
jgi:glycosyltransferase involved in cell wall biosynthesis